MIQPANDEQAAYKERALKVEPRHVANFVSWLCSENAQAVTGQIFGVRAREIMLFTQSEPAATAISQGEEWSLNEISDAVDKKFQVHFSEMRTDLEVFNTDPVI